MYKHFIWDFDGTLFDTYPVMGNAFLNTLLEEGFDESLDEVLKNMKISVSHTIKYYQQKYNIDSAFIEKYNILRKESEPSLCKPYKGINEICKYIHDSGRKNYLYTHRSDSSIVFLKQYGLYDYFTDFITSNNGFEKKPSPNAINYLIDKHNITHSEAIMIGDRDLDILSAKNAGIHGCFFNDGYAAIDIADFIINDFEELYSIIS